MAKLSPELLTRVAERGGREAEARLLREMVTEGTPMHDLIHHGRYRTRDAAPMAGRSGSTSASNYSYPPAGGAAWRGETLRNETDPEQFGGRGLPGPGEPIPRETPVEANMPFEYGTGGERGRDRRASGRDLGAHLRASGLRGGSPPRDESGFIQPIRRGDPDDPDEQGLGYQEREDFTGDDLDLSDQHDDEPIGVLPVEYRGEPRDYFLAHDAATGTIGIFRHGADWPVARFRPSPGTGVSDCRIAKDRRSGRIAVLRRRRGDRMRRLRREAADIARRPTRDGALQERRMLTVQNSINAEFWRQQPNGRGDFWNRRP
jgi:hypothetical protein